MPLRQVAEAGLKTRGHVPDKTERSEGVAGRTGRVSQLVGDCRVEFGRVYCARRGAQFNMAVGIAGAIEFELLWHDHEEPLAVGCRIVEPAWLVPA